MKPLEIWLRPGLKPQRISHIIFDFDGTLSWIRHGWPDIMIGLFQEFLSPQGDESKASLTEMLRALVLGLNGMPSIVQMMRFAELASSRGVSVPSPDQLLTTYHERLDATIQKRLDQISRGQKLAEQYLFCGARDVVELMAQAKMKLYILSTTLEKHVRAEAELLDLTRYFGGRIIGGTGEATFSKKGILNRILIEENIPGHQLLSFGDGPTEIRNTHELGGLGVAVCSDEKVNGSGIMDPYKRQQLIEAGADIAVPDFRPIPELLSTLVAS